MTLPPSSSDAGRDAERSQAFERLHQNLQRWVWAQGWTSLRDIQEQAIPPVLDGKRDVLIAAATAGGKTEAAFLPILSHIASKPARGIRVLGLSPLKALINDQHRRLQGLGECVQIPIHRWHGDVGQSQKERLLRDPSGVLLITPESLEAMFIRRGTLLRGIFEGLTYVVVDEFHAFLGTERGRQLQSLLHRLELVLRRRTPRIALSATLGDMGIAADFLRPPSGEDVLRLISSEPGGEVKLQLRGYIDPARDKSELDGGRTASATRQITDHLFRTLRGKRNLLFINRKSQVEEYADALRRRSEVEHVPNEFYPHHGSLSKSLREDVERMLKDGELPVSAVCTSTLELGIDIGRVESIAQVGPPPGVASLRQRLGRSGRRGDPAVLRIYVDEPELTPASPVLDSLRLELFQAAAMVRLLVAGWCEPPVRGALHLSTLVQQTLSVIAQLGGANALDVWRALCSSGPFCGVDSKMFAAFLRSLSAHDLVTQSSDDDLLLGQRGEGLVDNYDFYVAFATDDEYSLEHDGHPLGSLPIRHALIPGQLLIFAGRRWTIVHVDDEQRRVAVAPARGGSPPKFFGGGAQIHDRVREEMFRLYIDGEHLVFLDPNARKLLQQGRESFASLQLNRRRFIQDGDDCMVFLWVGDRVLDTVVAMLQKRGVKSAPCDVCLVACDTTERSLMGHFEEILGTPPPDPVEVALAVGNKHREKHDRYLSEALLCADYASADLDANGAWSAIRLVAEGRSPISC